MQLDAQPRALSRTVSKWFPTPEILYPRSAGIDISDSSVKWLSLSPYESGFRVANYGSVPLQPGIVVSGAIKDVAALGIALSALKKNLGGIRAAHAALPEEAAYVFEMHVPDGSTHEQILQMIEFEFEGRVPIPPSAAVFDYDVIERHDTGCEIAVAVFPRELAESYVAAFAAAGIKLLSLEVEASSIARAVSSNAGSDSVTLMVDFGRARTGFSVLRHGVPIFTSTVDVGGEAMTRAMIEKMKVSEEEALRIRNEEGLLAPEGIHSPGVEAVSGVASALADEIARHYHYWDTRRDERGDRMGSVSEVILVGGSSNLRGLPEYIAGRVQAPTHLGDVWGRVCDFNEYVPPIDKPTSLQYAAAVGLALRGV